MNLPIAGDGGGGGGEMNFSLMWTKSTVKCFYIFPGNVSILSFRIVSGSRLYACFLD